MSYKDRIADAMSVLGKYQNVVAIGYNVGAGSKGGGTFNGFHESRLIEMPVSEALMMGVAIGMSLDGLIPIVLFERMDFLLLALDQIVNHLDKLNALSNGLHKPAVIIRCVVGNSKTPLFTGPTHCQDFSEALSLMVSFPVLPLVNSSAIAPAYEHAFERARTGESTCLVEYKDQYSDEG